MVHESSLELWRGLPALMLLFTFRRFKVSLFREIFWVLVFILGSLFGWYLAPGL